MNKAKLSLLVLVIIGLSVLSFWRITHADAPVSSTGLLEERRPTSGMLGRYDFSSPDRVIELPKVLKEVSGAALYADSRLLVHEDERAIVYELLPDGSFSVFIQAGKVPQAGDFEALAVVGEVLYLLVSDGRMLVMDLERQSVDWVATSLGNHCELEGLDYSHRLNRLIYVCKTVLDRTGVIRLYHSDLALTEFKLLFELNEGGLPGQKKNFAPSALVAGDSIILASARQERLLELDWNGEVLNDVALDRKRHPQTEGLALMPDGSLILLDEGKKRARLHQYDARN